MEKNHSRAPAGGELLRVLAPVVELAAQMRPRLVLLVSLASGGCLLCGLVYHQDKQALQSRLRLYYPTGPEANDPCASRFSVPVGPRPLPGSGHHIQSSSKEQGGEILTDRERHDHTGYDFSKKAPTLRVWLRLSTR